MSEKISIANAVIMVVCTMFGCGVLLLPMSFLVLYYPYAIALFIAVAVFTATTLYFLCMAAHTLSDEKIDYATLCSKIHPVVGHYINAAVLLAGVISCTIYCKFVYEFLCPYFASSLHFGMKFALFLVFSVGAYLKDLNRLQKLGYLSITSIVLLAGIIIFYLGAVGPAPISSTNATQFKNSLSNMVFAFACHQSVVTVYSSLAVPSLRNIKILCAASVCASGLIYGFIALGGAFLLGSDLANKGHILQAMNDNKFAARLASSIDKNGLFLKLALLSFSMMITASFSFQFHPARAGLMNIITAITGREFGRRDIQRNITTTAMLATILAIFLIEPHINTLVNCANAFGSVGFTVILPCLVYFKTQRKMSFMKILSLGMAMVGIPLIPLFLAQ